MAVMDGLWISSQQLLPLAFLLASWFYSCANLLLPIVKVLAEAWRQELPPSPPVVSTAPACSSAVILLLNRSGQLVPVLQHHSAGAEVI